MELLQNEGRGARLFARRRERTSRLEALIERQSTPVAGKSATEGRAVPPLLTGCADTSEKVGVDLQWGAWPTRVTPPVGVAAKLRSTSSKKAPLKSGKGDVCNTVPIPCTIHTLSVNLVFSRVQHYHNIQYSSCTTK